MTDEIKTKAIVTRSIPYHESDMLVTLVSPEYGKLTATARGCLKPKAKLRFASEILNFGDYVLTGKNGRYVITECSQIEPFISITYDIEKFYAASLILDMLQKLSKESNPLLFIHSLECINDLAYGEKSTDDVVRDFLLVILIDNGYNFDFKHCGICGCDIEKDAYYTTLDGIVCNDCKGNGGYFIDVISRKYIAKEINDLSHDLKNKANMILADIIFNSLGEKVDINYFTEIL